jgi:kinase suppressor of Ras 2
LLKKLIFFYLIINIIQNNFYLRTVEVLSKNDLTNKKYQKIFKEELLNYKKTRHDNVELFLGACLTFPKLAIVTRNYRGWRLDHHIRDQNPSLDHARMIAEHICQGLGYLHSRKIVHRDLRPANVMFDQAGKVNKFVKVSFAFLFIFNFRTA